MVRSRLSHPIGTVDDMEANAVRFADAARRLGDAARSGGLLVPTFRSPPRPTGPSRTLHRRSDGSVSVSVLRRSRPWPAVVADMIDGVVVANRLSPIAAGEWRDRLWRAMEIEVQGPLAVERAA
jgi:hypothetical protein